MENLTRAEQREELINNFISNLSCEIDLDYRLDGFDWEDTVPTFDDIRDYLEENDAFNEEIVYYARAIDYLKENDPSLQESLSIASELGYNVSDLSSEILATLLYQQQIREEFEELQDDFEELFEQLEEFDNETEELELDEE